MNATLRNKNSVVIVDPNLFDFWIIEERLQNTETVNLLRDVAFAHFICIGIRQRPLVSPANFRDDGVPNIVAAGDSTANSLDDCGRVRHVPTMTKPGDEPRVLSTIVAITPWG